MIQGNKNKDEQGYREITLDSSSSLKDFCLDRKKYYKKYLLNEEEKDDDTQASIMGRLVETLLMEPELFDKKFHMSACASAPTGLMLKFVEALYRIAMESVDDEGSVTKSFEDMSKEAYIQAGYKLPYNTIMKQFIGSDAEIYYEEIRVVRANNLTVVTTDNVTNAEKIVETLRTNPITRDILNLTSSKRYSVYNQFQVENYDVDGHKFKSMLDR